MRTPSAPTLTPMKMITWPNGDQYVPMLTVDSPVTQIVETAVKSASANGADCPLAVEAGSDSRAVKMRISVAKTRTAKRAGDAVVRSCSLSHPRRADDDRRQAREPLGSAAIPDPLARNVGHGSPGDARLT